MRIDNVLDGASLIVDFRIESNLKYDRQGNDLLCIGRFSTRFDSWNYF
jgi:hypothetical protein